MIIAAPSNENECRQLLTSAYQHQGPSAVRYPRGEGIGIEIESELTPLPIGKGVLLKRGNDVAILNFGVLLPQAEEAANTLGATLADMRWVKPLDEALILELASTHRRLVTVEENAIAGGAGSAVAELLAEQSVDCEIAHVAITDKFIDHASQGETRFAAGLSTQAIIDKAKQSTASAPKLSEAS